MGAIFSTKGWAGRVQHIPEIVCGNSDICMNANNIVNESEYCLRITNQHWKKKEKKNIYDLQYII